MRRVFISLFVSACLFAVGLAHVERSSAAYEPPRVLVASAVSESAGSQTLITGLSFWGDANTKYEVRGTILWDSASANTGCQFALNGPASSTLRVHYEYPNTAASANIRVLEQTSLNTLVASSASSATTNNAAYFRGVITTSSTAGAISMKFATEINTSQVTIQAGSNMSYQRIP